MSPNCSSRPALFPQTDEFGIALNKYGAYHNSADYARAQKFRFKVVDLEVGDVITSPRFEYCYRCEGRIIATSEDPEPGTKAYIYRNWIAVCPGFETLEKAKCTTKQMGFDPDRLKEEDLSAIDSSRRAALFVVVSTGGSRYAPTIEARRLSANGFYDLGGEMICFHAGRGERNDFVSFAPFGSVVTDIRVVKKMNQVFI